MPVPRRALVVLLMLAATGCAGGSDEDPGAAPTGTGPWADIDTARPSEDPVATVFGFVQAMAAGDEAAACAFQYRGSSDYDDEPCVLDRELGRRDAARQPDDWRALAAYRLEDYRAADAGRTWRVTLPTGPATSWRIRQDDAGLWYVV